MVDEKILELVKGKERKKYARKHGISALINMYHDLPWNDAESERVYKICNQKKITWEEFYKLKDKDLIF